MGKFIKGLNMEDVDSILKKIKNKRMLLVFPHPDDESVWCVGLMRRALELSYKVKLLCLTKGDKGKNYLRHDKRNLKLIRSEELQRAMGLLGVSDYEMKDFGDAKLRIVEGWKKRVKKVLTDYKPGIVVTYDHAGVGGHPDHIAVSVWLSKYLNKKRNMKLWWVIVDNIWQRKWFGSQVMEYASKPKMVVRLSLREMWIKYLALRAHKCQALLKKRKIWEVLFARKEYFSEADYNKGYKYFDYQI